MCAANLAVVLQLYNRFIAGIQKSITLDTKMHSSLLVHKMQISAYFLNVKCLKTMFYKYSVHGIPRAYFKNNVIGSCTQKD